MYFNSWEKTSLIPFSFFVSCSLLTSVDCVAMPYCFLSRSSSLIVEDLQSFNNVEEMEHDRQVGSDADHHYNVACCPQLTPLACHSNRSLNQFAASLRTPRFLFKCLRSKYNALSRRLSLFTYRGVGEVPAFWMTGLLGPHNH